VFLKLVRDERQQQQQQQTSVAKVGVRLGENFCPTLEWPLSRGSLICNTAVRERHTVQGLHVYWGGWTKPTLQTQ